MSLVLSTNLNSLVAQNALASSGSALASALQQLSTGLRINTAADDAAGYAIVQGITSQVNGLNQAAQNANDGVSLTQTGAGALQEITKDLQTMRDLAVQSLNVTNSAIDRTDLNQQFAQLQADIDNVAKTTQFNGVNLLDGSFSGSFQIGANVGQQITVSQVGSARTSALGLYTGTNQTNVAVGATGASTIVVGGSTYALGTVTGDAAIVTAAINNAGVSGLTATANAASSAAGTGSYTATAATNLDSITVNGIAVAVTNSGVFATNVANAVTAINGVSASTGVSAAVNGSGGITLSNQTGGNITMAFAETTKNGAAASTVADYGLTGVGATTTSTYNLSYVAPSGVGGNLVTTGALGANSYAIASTGAAVSTLSVTSVSNSNTALTAIDSALQQVATVSAQLGAYQNRFQAAITGINTTSTNLAAARSGIQDTDYAQATSALTKAQILQQAGTAMVAQANTLPQNVLTLIQHLPQ
ncbi:MAG TPA: flagellin [Steroidobacteraceae bacterium]|nr:flagellin [Steroidobacteraceae bacterium]